MSGTLPVVPSQNNGRKVSFELNHDELQSISNSISTAEEPVQISRPRPNHLKLKPAIKNSFRRNTISPGSIGSYSVKNQYVHFLTLKILFVDLFVSFGNVGSDFTFAFQELLMQEGKWQYGCISLAINWLPGLAASIYVLTMYRQLLKPKFVILYAVLVFVLYPIVPTLAYITLLWTRPSVFFRHIF